MLRRITFNEQFHNRDLKQMHSLTRKMFNKHRYICRYLCHNSIQMNEHRKCNCLHVTVGHCSVSMSQSQLFFASNFNRRGQGLERCKYHKAKITDRFVTFYRVILFKPRRGFKSDTTTFIGTTRHKTSDFEKCVPFL